VNTHEKIIAFIIVLVILSTPFLWMIGKKINYNLSYKSMVEKTVADMVKKESLK